MNKSTDVKNVFKSLLGGKPLFLPDDETTVPDAFDPKKQVDLLASEPPVFNLVDGTVAIATDPSMPFVLFKGYNQDTWFYAPRWGRLAKNAVGRPAFTVSERVKKNLDGSVTTLGGVLSFMVELVVELPDATVTDAWTRLIKTLYNLRPSSGKFNFQPLPMSNGTMSVYGLNSYVLPGQKLTDIPVGASSTIAFAIELNDVGADFLYSLVGAGGNAVPQVAVLFNFNYERYVPTCKIHGYGFKKTTFDYFSEHVSARANYWGLWGGSYDRQTVRADLRRTQGLTIDIVGDPPVGIEKQKLIDSINDIFIKLSVGEWIKPESIQPANASAPGGYFGGVSYAMKDLHFSDTDQFTIDYTFSKIEKEIHQVSFSFEQQVSEIPAADIPKHAILIEDDDKLPLSATFSASDMISQYGVNCTYTLANGQTRMIKFDPIDAKKGAIASVNGVQGGVIQFPAHSPKPSSAQMEVTVDFSPPLTGYKHREVIRIEDVGAAFYFHPDTYVQRTQVFFVFTSGSNDTTARALFQWRYVPPPPRAPSSAYILVLPDPTSALYNLPTNVIKFPFHTSDWKPDGSGPTIEVSVSGQTGRWKGKKVSGRINLFDPAVEIDWDGIRTISNGARGAFSLVIPGHELIKGGF